MDTWCPAFEAPPVAWGPPKLLRNWLKSMIVPVPVGVNGIVFGFVGVKLSATAVVTPLMTVV